ncbi:MAG: 50S ribosomal protein L6 [Planctomycetota bacterium]
MSRIGTTPITVPDGVGVSVGDSSIGVTGPKGSAQMAVSPAASVTFDAAAKQITVRQADMSGVGARAARKQRAMWSTTHRLIASMIAGVTEGYTRQLQIVGVGYNAKVEGRNLLLRCGFANELSIPIPENITVDPPESGNIMISGAGQMPCLTVTMHSVDKQAIGQFAAAVRHLRPPEPYKGKGIRYMNEEVKRKAGKALAGTTGQA